MNRPKPDANPGILPGSLASSTAWTILLHSRPWPLRDAILWPCVATVVATGDWADGACEAADWRDVVAVGGGSHHTVGLTSDGRVLAAGDNSSGQCAVTGWAGVVAIAAGSRHTLGLLGDGTAVATGADDDGQCEVSKWRPEARVMSHLFAVGPVTFECGRGDTVVGLP